MVSNQTFLQRANKLSKLQAIDLTLESMKARLALIETTRAKLARIGAIDDTILWDMLEATSMLGRCLEEAQAMTKQARNAVAGGDDATATT